LTYVRSASFVFYLIGYLVMAYPSYAEKIDSIDDLVLLDDVVLCKNCHKEHGSQWPKSAHSGSVADHSTLKAFKSYIEFTQESAYGRTAGLELRDNCFTCHAPRVKNASDSLLKEISGLIITAVEYQGTLKGKSAVKELSKISIDCGVCHLIYGMPEGEIEPNILYGPGWDEHELAHTRDHGFDTIGSPYLMSSDMCTRCHHELNAGIPSIVKKMHKNSQSHFMEANNVNKTCQSCHMMDGEMIIHNMPRYSGTLNFPIKKTADRIGMTMGVITFLSIILNLIGMAFSKRKQRKRAQGVDLSVSLENMPAINTEALCPYEAGAAVQEDNIIVSDGNTSGENHKEEIS
jgi:hypothetical protein